jgi:hypothetical protein
LHNQGLSDRTIYRMMNNENREKLQIKTVTRDTALFYKDSSLPEIDPEVEKEGKALAAEQQKEIGLPAEPEVLMKKGEHLQCFQKEQTSNIKIKALEKEIKNSRRVVFPLKLLQDYREEHDVSPASLDQIIILQQNGKAIKVIDIDKSDR